MYFRATIAATAGTKMSGDYPWAVAPYPRRIRGILLTGGSAAGDTNFVLKAGQIQIAKLYNITIVATTDVDDMFKCGLYVPANVPLYGAVGETAAGSGNVYLHLDIVPSRIPVVGGEVFMKPQTTAQAVLNSDVLDDESIKTSTLPRVIRSVGLTGSAAVGDTIYEGSVGNMLFTEVYNTTLGLAPMQHKDMMPMTQYVGAGKEIEFKCTDASATNTVMFVIVLGGIAPRRQFRAFRGRR